MNNTQQTDQRTRAEKLRAQDLVNSLTGFEELAITRAFGQPLEELSGSLTMRALVFVADKRDGAKDGDAYRSVMSTPISDITDRFDVDTDDTDDTDDRASDALAGLEGVEQSPKAGPAVAPE